MCEREREREYLLQRLDDAGFVSRQHHHLEASTMECGGERQAHIAHSNDSGHGRLSFNALQQRRKVSGAFIRRLLTCLVLSAALFRGNGVIHRGINRCKRKLVFRGLPRACWEFFDGERSGELQGQIF